ncbi:hypothetical protein OVS_03865 [Mycoplasma ovis str. Michigan]|uniref:Uncharacterized protein n=1 Tax=Mycoplasma ovis str. Michigan TaxID=1415773 RepID=A0ABN4BMA7_9MOLU|nr:hypothetical protein [Mycoplasma ovis]AHC40505.1 hypothetical protein OVS_03865 [Mycoplasma ovis str. Michigan]
MNKVKNSLPKKINKQMIFQNLKNWIKDSDSETLEHLKSSLNMIKKWEKKWNIKSFYESWEEHKEAYEELKEIPEFPCAKELEEIMNKTLREISQKFRKLYIFRLTRALININNDWRCKTNFNTDKLNRQDWMKIWEIAEETINEIYTKKKTWS